MDSLPVAGLVGTAVYESCLPIRERQRRRHQGAAAFAALVMLLGMAAAIVAGINSTGCASQEEADAAAGVAAQRIEELKTTEADAAARHDQAAADEARLMRGRIEAALAQVRGAAAAKPTPAEPAAQGIAAALLPGGVGAAIAGGLGLVGHVMRSKRLRDAIDALGRTLANTDAEATSIVESIEDAKEAHPEFAAAFKTIGGTLTQRQTLAAQQRVSRVQAVRRTRRRPSSPQPASSAPAALA